MEDERRAMGGVRWLLAAALAAFGLAAPTTEVSSHQIPSEGTAGFIRQGNRVRR